MADPWGSAIQGFKTGVPMGIRSSERAEDKAEKEGIETTRKAERAEDVKYRGEGLKIRQAAEGRAKKDWDAKELSKIANKYMNISRAHNLSGRNYAAGEAMVRAYSEIKNGDELQIYQREYLSKTDKTGNLTNKVFGDIKPEDTVLLVSKLGGKIPFKNMRAAIEYGSKLLNAKDVNATMMANQARIDQKNAGEKEYLTKTGEHKIDTWVRSPVHGGPIKGESAEYTGPIRISEKRQEQYETLGGRFPTPEEARIQEGFIEKEKQPLQTTAKAEAELQGKNFDMMKKKLDLAMRLFKKSAKSVFDFTTGKITTEGGNAIQSAQKLVEKSKTAPESLTPTEKTNLPKAISALKLYDQISLAVTESTKPESSEGDYENKRAPDGKLYTKKNGVVYLVEEEQAVDYGINTLQQSH